MISNIVIQKFWYLPAMCQVSLLKQDFERRERSLQQMLDQVAAGPDGAAESVRKCHFIGKNMEH